MARYDRGAEGEAARHTQAIHLLQRYDVDADSGINEEEFNQMTRAVLGPPAHEEEEALGAEGTAGAEAEEKDIGRNFKKRERSRFLEFITSSWVMVPVFVICAVCVLAYRSTVRRSKKVSRWARAGYTVSNRSKQK
jgi:hypothetical protein